MFGFIRVNRIRGLLEVHKELADRVHRLEMANKQVIDQLELLQGQHNKLRARVVGSMGGRPVGSVTQLSDIPIGDKAALRRALLPQHLPRTQEQRE